MSGILAVAPSISAMTATPASTTTPSAALGTAFGAALATGGANLAATQRHARLVDAAQQFEGMMLEQLLKPLQKSQDTGFGGDSDTDPDADRDGSLDTLSSYGTEAVANSIARSGGLGSPASWLRTSIGSTPGSTPVSKVRPKTPRGHNPLL